MDVRAKERGDGGRTVPRTTRITTVMFLDANDMIAKNRMKIDSIASLPGFMMAFEEPVLYRIVWAPTFEQGRQSDAWSGCVSTRSHRRDDRDCRPATARARPL